ncbi:MAG: hypothetical protein CL840_21625 [Crocinitomicaceae bacterium]|nr:hypothetical protein [Crocinitomicaceae bacterium]|tara:strand:- start:3569 stop:4288 length:720 start_codon:yes stop_codon:yes gene_type:complete
MENRKNMSAMQFDITDIEWLDSNQAKGEQYRKVISQLDVINKYLGNESQMKKSIDDFLDNNSIEKGRTIRVTDLGCGSGYILKKVGDLLINRGYIPVLIGVDVNPEAIDLARGKLSQYDNHMICTAIDENFEIPTTDFLISSHFIYHLNGSQLKNFLLLNKNKIAFALFFSELYQSKLSIGLFQLFSRILNFENEVRQDGVKALKRAPKLEQFKQLFSSFHSIEVRKVPFFRTIISGQL